MTKTNQNSEHINNSSSNNSNNDNDKNDHNPMLNSPEKAKLELARLKKQFDDIDEFELEEIVETVSTPSSQSTTQTPLFEKQSIDFIDTVHDDSIEKCAKFGAKKQHFLFQSSPPSSKQSKQIDFDENNLVISNETLHFDRNQFDLSLNPKKAKQTFKKSKIKSYSRRNKNKQ